MNVPSAPALVSIGLPVYNEERFIDETLRSLRALDWPNLEIIICDNASTDATGEIARRHADEDPRLRYERADANRGVIANFRHAADQARGEYFMWAGGHDLWSGNLVRECVALLETHPNASLAFGSSCWIGVDGTSFARESGWSDTRGIAAAGRFFTIFWGNMHPVMGLMRLSRLRECRPLPNLVGGDLVLLSELALRGDFLHAPKALWSRREIRVETHHDDKIRRYASAESGISRSRLSKLFPLVKLPLALCGAVVRAPLRWVDKITTLAALVPSLALRYVVGRQRPGSE